ESLNTQDILIQWRTYEGLIVHTFVQGEDNLINQDKQFKGRTHLITSELSRGDFSLSLSDVSITDEGDCTPHITLVAGETLLIAHCCDRKLKAYYGHQIKFTCKSTGGFPKPKVYWLVNKKPLEDSSQVDTIVSTDCRAWYSVTSVLNVVVREDMSVTCTVENEKLGEKRTSPEIQCRVNHKCKYRNSQTFARLQSKDNQVYHTFVGHHFLLLLQVVLLTMMSKTCFLILFFYRVPW
uniref:Ig-like domain-containing protein n=1 Tax=Erpetoichthys calabaricus TaxID=27687 RepID=A0A8C4SZ34_ERPCA